MTGKQSPKPFLSLVNTTFRMGDHFGFENTTWRIHEGEQWAVVGPNGSGKSVLVSAFAGHIPIVRGEVFYHFACADPEESYPEDGTVPEEQIAYVTLEEQHELVAHTAHHYQSRWYAGEDEEVPTVRDWLHWPRRVPPVVGLLGIAPLLKRKLLHLSNGETRKVLLAKALLSQPKLLVLDNPFAGLDAESRKVLNKIIADLDKHGLRLIFVMRSAEELPPCVTHVLEVADTRVRRQGPRAEVAGKVGRKAGTREKPLVLPTVNTPGKTLECHNECGEVLVDIRHANIRYGSVQVLDDISWRIRAGEHWALTGPNGAGKTTLLSLIVGDNPQAYANPVALFGNQRGSGESMWDIKRKIGWLAPDLVMHYPAFSRCIDVVCSGFHDSLGLHRRATPTQRRAAKEWLAALGLLQEANKPLGALSDGLQRMVLLARAVVKQPKLLVLDEPTHGLDAEHREMLLSVVNAIGEQGLSTLIFVSHYREEIPPCIHRELRLNKGRGRELSSSIPTFEDIVQVKQFGYGVRYCNLGSLEKVVSNSGEGEDAFCDGICLEGFSKTL